MTSNTLKKHLLLTSVFTMVITLSTQAEASERDKQRAARSSASPMITVPHVAPKEERPASVAGAATSVPSTELVLSGKSGALDLLLTNPRGRALQQDMRSKNEQDVDVKYDDLKYRAEQLAAQIRGRMQEMQVEKSKIEMDYPREWSPKIAAAPFLALEDQATMCGLGLFNGSQLIQLESLEAAIMAWTQEYSGSVKDDMITVSPMLRAAALKLQLELENLRNNRELKNALQKAILENIAAHEDSIVVNVLAGIETDDAAQKANAIVENYPAAIGAINGISQLEIMVRLIQTTPTHDVSRYGTDAERSTFGSLQRRLYRLEQVTSASTQRRLRSKSVERRDTEDAKNADIQARRDRLATEQRERLAGIARDADKLSMEVVQEMSDAAENVPVTATTNVDTAAERRWRAMAAMGLGRNGPAEE